MQKNQEKNLEAGGLFQELGTEVSQESAPLLEFITKNGGKIAACVLILVVITGISALWQWQKQKGHDAFIEEMASQDIKLSGNEKVKAFADLAERAPSDMRAIAQLRLADIASENQDMARAKDAYALAAQADADGVTGSMAALAQAASLLRLEKYDEALSLLQSLEQRFSGETPFVLRSLTADAAERSGKKELAAQILKEMASSLPEAEAGFLTRRAEELSSTNPTATTKEQ
ncbi:MAG: tetratricopeptide repeat protein [Desulfovibrio sp.]|nr:tetratricopeptide repeat protein [Desulfovibrio sp.]